GPGKGEPELAPRLRGHELDSRGSARRGEDGHPPRPCRGGLAVLQSADARGGEPRRGGSFVEPVVGPDGARRREPGQGGHHPRTRKNLVAFDLWDRLQAKVKAIEPVDYLDFITLLMGSSKVVTDSGGVQKEAYFFGIPCVTLRDETEWIETLEDGWNALVGTETDEILHAIEKFNPEGTKSKSFGDGHAAEKIARILDKFV